MQNSKSKNAEHLSFSSETSKIHNRMIMLDVTREELAEGTDVSLNDIRKYESNSTGIASGLCHKFAKLLKARSLANGNKNSSI